MTTSCSETWFQAWGIASPFSADPVPGRSTVTGESAAHGLDRRGCDIETHCRTCSEMESAGQCVPDEMPVLLFAPTVRSRVADAHMWRHAPRRCRCPASTPV